MIKGKTTCFAHRTIMDGMNEYCDALCGFIDCEGCVFYKDWMQVMEEDKKHGYERDWRGHMLYEKEYGVKE